MKKFDALVAGLRELGRSKRYLFLIYMVNMTITVIVAVGLAHRPCDARRSREP